MFHFLAVLIGVFVGLIVVGTYFQFDQGWKKLISFTSSQGVFLGFFIPITTYIDLPTEKKVSFLSVYLLVLILVIIFSILIFIHNQKKDKSKFNITFKDVLLGYKKSLIHYYDLRKQEVDNQLNVVELKKDEERLRELETNLSQKDELLNKKEKDLEAKVNNRVYINVPYQNKILLTDRFAKYIPKFIDHLSKFNCNLQTESINFIEDITKYKKNVSDKQLLKAYMNLISSYTSIYLFDSHDIRIHFRVLENEKYVKFATWYAGEESIKPLTDISYNNGMIYEAGKIKRSLVKSHNLDFHENSTNDHIWADYISLIFDDYYLDNNIPFISMGISVKDGETFNEMLSFLSYVKFEQIIQRYLNSFDDIINIKQTLLLN